MAPPRPKRFVRPQLPQRFQFVFEDGSSFGPFDRDAVHHEGDGAIVFFEDGWLPMRLGVIRQQDDLLDLFPEGRVRVVAS